MNLMSTHCDKIINIDIVYNDKCPIANSNYNLFYCLNYITPVLTFTLNYKVYKNVAADSE